MVTHLSVGSLVMYQGEKYTIKYIYDSGFCEIKKSDFDVKLVRLSDLNLSVYSIRY